MPRIWYYPSGATARETVSAPNLTSALLDLRERQISVASAGEDLPPPAGLARHWAALIPFYEQLSELLTRGTPLPQALLLLADQCSERPLRASLQQLAEEVAEGRPLHEAMALQPRMYPPAVVQAVAAAEAADELAATLAEVAAQQRQIRQATLRLLPLIIYPLVITGLITLDLLFLGTFIMPKFVSLYRELGMTYDRLPLLTRVLVPLAQTMPAFILVLALVITVVFALAHTRNRLLTGRFDVRTGWHHVPVLGALSSQIALARLASTLGLLLRRRAPTDQALRLAGGASQDPLYDRGLRQAALAVGEGVGVGEALRSTGLLPPRFVQEVSAAEAAGDLPGALRRLSDAYWQQILYHSRTLPYVVAPLIIVALGLIVLLIGAGMFAPLVAIIGELSG